MGTKARNKNIVIDCLRPKTGVFNSWSVLLSSDYNLLHVSSNIYTNSLTDMIDHHLNRILWHVTESALLKQYQDVLLQMILSVICVWWLWNSYWSNFNLWCSIISGSHCLRLIWITQWEMLPGLHTPPLCLLLWPLTERYESLYFS